MARGPSERSPGEVPWIAVEQLDEAEVGDALANRPLELIDGDADVLERGDELGALDIAGAERPILCRHDDAGVHEAADPFRGRRGVASERFEAQSHGAMLARSELPMPREAVVWWVLAALRDDAPRGRPSFSNGPCVLPFPVREALEVHVTTGTIKKVVADRGFGFIAAEDSKEYFFHRGGLDSSLDFDRLVGGERVEFEIEASPKGPRASQVRAA